MNISTIYEGRRIVDGTITVDLYAIDTADGTHWVTRINTEDGPVSVQVMHPYVEAVSLKHETTPPRVCYLDPTTTPVDWLECARLERERNRRVEWR